MNLPYLLCLVFLTYSEVQGHGRLMEPVSRASAWRKGFNNPADYNDNEGYCGGFSNQWMRNKGKCGICGDTYGVFPQDHAAPGGRYANGIIVKEYRVGQVIDVEIDISANHKGSFIFKLCRNNNIDRDKDQRCFDRHVLKVYPDMTDRYVLPTLESKTWHIKLKLPRRLTCAQCILQWTYDTANSWGTCRNGTDAMGCGPQETFRACSDIKISKRGPRPGSEQELLKQNPLGRPINHRPPSVRPSQRQEPPSRAVFKFFWMKPKDDPKTTTEVAITEKRKKKRKKISERPGITKEGRKKKRRRKNKNRRKKNKRRRKPLREPFVPEFQDVPILPDPVPAVPFFPDLPDPVPAVPLDRPKKFVPPPPPEKAKDATKAYGYFSLSMGTMEEDVHMFLGTDLERSDTDYEEIIDEFPRPSIDLL